MRPLDFQRKRENGGDSWERADPYAATLARMEWNEYAVRLPDGDESHIVTLQSEGQGYVGTCDCSGFKFNDGPCAHLCTLRKAEFIGAPDVRGVTVHIPDEMEAADHHVERVVADGGRRFRR